MIFCISLGQTSKKSKQLNVGDHLAVEGSTRRRYTRCTELKKEGRTKTLCRMSKTCFVPYDLN